jgi:omega-hydroxy-beta-dihydromenaquinone-9 sulfotransferase
MSVLTKRPEASRDERAVKHPLTWYMPRFWHGMRFSTWARELARNRLAISPSRVPMTCAITCFTALNSVLAALERVFYGRQIDAVQLSKPPLFILGHWRAGTTFLHELLIRDSAHTYFTTYQCFTPHHFVLSEKWVLPWVGIFAPERRPMDNMAAGWDRPMEDEFALQSLGVPTPYLSAMFPNRGPVYPEYLSLRELTEKQRDRWKDELLRFCKRVALRDKRRLVIKSPAHTARVRTLLEMFPDAKFVHLSRDPYALYRSTVALWRTLNAEEGLQVARHESWIGPFVIDSLHKMYDAYLEDRALLGDDQLVELRYEDLVDDPKSRLREVYARLDLGDFSGIEPALDEHLAEVKNYRRNRHSMDDETGEVIRREWARYFNEFGYD